MDSSVTAVQSDYSVYRGVIGDLLSGKEQLPSLPAITFEIRKAMGQQDLSMVELSKLLAKDPALSAVLLKCPCVIAYYDDFIVHRATSF